MKTSVETIKKLFTTADQLKKLDGDTYGQIFAWVNQNIKRGAAPAILLEAVTIAKSRAGYGQRPRDLFQYMNGITRSLREHKDATKMRAGQKTSVSEILGRALELYQNGK